MLSTPTSSTHSHHPLSRHSERRHTPIALPMPKKIDANRQFGRITDPPQRAITTFSLAINPPAPQFRCLTAYHRR